EGRNRETGLTTIEVLQPTGEPARCRIQWTRSRRPPTRLKRGYTTCVFDEAPITACRLRLAVPVYDDSSRFAGLLAIRPPLFCLDSWGTWDPALGEAPRTRTNWVVARAVGDASRGRRGARNECSSWYPDSEHIELGVDGHRRIGGVGTACRMDTADQQR